MRHLLGRLHLAVVRAIWPLPFEGRHVDYSAIAAPDDDPGQPSDRLIDLALQAGGLARAMDMRSVVERMPRPPHTANVWPGEHYKLLAALVAVLKPRVVVEIGTATGLSALALRSTLPAGGRLVTFDIIPWNQIADTCLREADLSGGTLSQVIGDLSRPAVIRQHAELLRSADLIFVDGPKDGRFEQVLIDHLTELGLPRRPVVVFDDIRIWNMLAIWRRLPKPKLDITSLGHWTGTGLVDWSG